MKLLFLLFLFSMNLKAAPKISEKLKKFFEGKTKIEEPFDLRDPFKPPKAIHSSAKEETNPFKRNGVYTNIAPVTEIEVEDLKILGVIIGKERRAIASTKGSGGGDGEKTSSSGGTFTLKEGMKIGKNDAELKAIVPGGVIFVERIKNVYGETEYLETVIPISQ